MVTGVDLQRHIGLEERGTELTLTGVQAPRLYPTLLHDSQPTCPPPRGLLTRCCVAKHHPPDFSSISQHTGEQSLREKTQVQRGILGVPEIIFSQLKQPSLQQTELLPAAGKEEQE